MSKERGLGKKFFNLVAWALPIQELDRCFCMKEGMLCKINFRCTASAQQTPQTVIADTLVQTLFFTHVKKYLVP